MFQIGFLLVKNEKINTYRNKKKFSESQLRVLNLFVQTAIFLWKQVVLKAKVFSNENYVCVHVIPWR